MIPHFAYFPIKAFLTTILDWNPYLINCSCISMPCAKDANLEYTKRKLEKDFEYGLTPANCIS